MSLKKSICCCFGLDRDKSKEKLEDGKRHQKLPEPFKPSNGSQLQIAEKKKDKLEASKLNLKSQIVQKSENFRQQHQMFEKKDVHRRQLEQDLVRNNNKSNLKDYGDDVISAQFSSADSRKIKTLAQSQFFILPCEPVMQFYQHETLQIQGLIPGNDIQYY